MTYANIVPGRDVPTDVNALIEIEKGQGRVKYEFNRQMGCMVVDRIRDNAPLYPINYGCIPHTLSDDGDPLDIIVLGEPVMTGVILPARPVAVLLMDDEKGHDVKILAVPAGRVSAEFNHIQRLEDVPKADIEALEAFFRGYKTDEADIGKWSKTAGWQDVNTAHDYIHNAIARAANKP